MSSSDTELKPFDIFLCHNREDKPEIRRIADDLIKQGIKPWLDEREIKPGDLWQTALEEQVATIKSAAVFVGESGLGPWQNIEMRAFINEFVERKCPVVPAILPSAKSTPSLPILLKSLHYVDFRIADPDPLMQLKWGITGIKPKPQPNADVETSDSQALLPEKAKQSIEIRLPGNIESFTSNDREKLLDAISKLLQIDGELKITAMRAGSVRLFLELTPEDADKIYESINSGQLDNLGITEARLYPSLTDPPNQEQRSQLLILLNRVKEFWIEGVLKKSLYHEVLLSLGKRVIDEAVEPPWNQTVDLPKQRHHLSLSDTRIETVFDTTGLLLILGEPGSGKTTTLLELASILLARVEKDSAERIPIVLNLSSWNKQQKLEEWMADRLSNIYSVPRQIARSWLGKGYLIPMLDGLDEVKTEQQADCVAAINEYITKTEPDGLVVCCRLMEYQWLPDHLKLNGAICIEPLNRQQIDQYFTSIGSEFESLRIAIQGDPILQELTQSPLMLNIMSITYQSAILENVAEGANSLEARRTQIFASYVNKMFERKATLDHFFPKEKVIIWLSWLARKMTEQSQSVFFVENLQPLLLLDNRKQQLAYRAISSLIIGLVFGLIVGLGLGLQLGLLAWLMTFSAIGLCARSNSSLKNGIYCIAISCLIGGLFGWLEMNSILFGFIYGVIIGLILWSIIVSVGTLDGIKTVEFLRWSWKSFVVNAFKGALPGGLFSGLIGWFCSLLNILTADTGIRCPNISQQEWVIVGGLIIGLICGVLGGFTNLTREDKPLPNQGIILSRKIGICVALIFLLASGLIGLIQGVSVLSFGLMAGWIAGLYRGLGAVIKHYALRLVLWHTGKIPFMFIPFLDYCARLILLKKVGGGYIFIHRMLLEYFAKLGTPDDK